MSKQIDFLKRCIALNLQSGGLLDLLDRIEELEQERDQLREQIASLKDELRQISTAIDDVRLDLTNTAAELIM